MHLAIVLLIWAMAAAQDDIPEVGEFFGLDGLCPELFENEVGDLTTPVSLTGPCGDSDCVDGEACVAEDIELDGFENPISLYTCKAIVSPDCVPAEVSTEAPATTVFYDLDTTPEYDYDTTADYDYETTTVQPTTTEPTVPETTTYENNLEITTTTTESEHCCYWATKGECDSNPFWMKINCPIACGTSAATLENAGTFPISIDMSCGPMQQISKPTVDTNLETTTMKVPSPSDCSDTDASCTGWANGGECEANPDWMNVNCPKSCKTCPPSLSGLCQDNDKYCSYWQRKNQCEINPGWMNLNCRKSCGKCDEPHSIVNHSIIPEVMSEDGGYKLRFIHRRWRNILRNNV